MAVQMQNEEGQQEMNKEGSWLMKRNVVVGGVFVVVFAVVLALVLLTRRGPEESAKGVRLSEAAQKLNDAPDAKTVQRLAKKLFDEDTQVAAHALADFADDRSTAAFDKTHLFFMVVDPSDGSTHWVYGGPHRPFVESSDPTIRNDKRKGPWNTAESWGPSGTAKEVHLLRIEPAFADFVLKDTSNNGYIGYRFWFDRPYGLSITREDEDELARWRQLPGWPARWK